ncbi:MAG: low molecular weight phosphotyrosine protein phosphatase [Fibrobacteraceae bacterium]|nr:low molecular weight phosphotyrosine protein phosphatase [Fibrobacteraceae bacterium]
MKKILVLCTGNICRSPTAEFLLRRALGAEYSVMSAGLGAVVDSGPEKLALKVALEHGLDISAHRAHQVTMDMLKWADLVLVMENGQKDVLLYKYPWLNGRIFRYGDEAKVDVPDPHGRPESAFAMSWNFISRFTPHWVNYIKQFV